MSDGCLKVLCGVRFATSLGFLHLLISSVLIKAHSLSLMNERERWETTRWARLAQQLQA